MAKTYDSLYTKLCSFQNLHLAFQRARKRKSKKQYVSEFELQLERELLTLKRELEAQTYKPRPLRRFVIRDPKTRVIHASHFRDRVVHHAVCNLIEPIFDKTFIYDSYANRRNRGNLAALERYDGFQKKVSDNGRLVHVAKDANMVVGYALKADIKHYFPSVDHEILLRQIRRKITDEKVMWLIQQILEANTIDEPKGMPIGNLTSQLFANIYLGDLDRFVKQTLRAKYYLRYVDDFVVLDREQSVLQEYRERINDFLRTHLRIELHEQKSKVYPLHTGINLLGYRVFYYYKIPKKSNLRKLDKRMREFSRQHASGAISAERIAESLDSWFAYMEYGNTFKLRTKLLDRYSTMCRENLRTYSRKVPV